LTGSGFILKNFHLGYPRLLAFMNQMFGFSGSRDECCKKTFLQSVGELHRKSYPQLREKATQHENKSAQDAETLICTIIAQLPCRPKLSRLRLVRR